MTQLPASLQSTLDDYQITADTLWTFFSKTSETLQKHGQPPVSQAFAMASPGAKGVEEITSIENKAGRLLGCFSLAHLRSTRDQLQNTPEIKDESSLISRLLPGREFVIVTGGEVSPQMVRATASSLERAMEATRKVYPDAALAFGGDIEDLDSLITQMESICSDQDFSQVFRDRRDHINGWPAQRLLSSKKNPESTAAYFDAALFPEMYR